MNTDTINAYDNQYKEEGGCWNKESCVVNNTIETYSGPGSLLKNTEILRERLQLFIDRYNIKSIIDVPCGDFNYMKEVNLNNVQYNGYDISKNAIAKCLKYKTNNINFHNIDATVTQLPYSDLIICKDLFLHLSFEHIHNILQNIKNTKCKYFAVSRYSYGNVVNNDQNSGVGCRAIEVTRPPFNMLENDIIEHIPYSSNYNNDELIIFKM